MTLWDCVQCICVWFYGTVNCSKLSRDHPRSWDCELFQDVLRPSKITGLWTVSRCPETIQDHGTVNHSKMSSDQLNLIWKKMDMGMGWTQKWNSHGNCLQPSLCHAKAILSTGIGVDSSEARINGQTMSPVRTQIELRAAQRGLRPCLYSKRLGMWEIDY